MTEFWDGFIMVVLCFVLAFAVLLVSAIFVEICKWRGWWKDD